MAQLRLENVSKVFPGPQGQSISAVRQVTLTAEDKELLVLVGPSGSGKSTLLRLMAGLEELTQGRILMDGQAINDLDPQDRDVAMVFQNGALYPHMTAFENMAFGLKLRRFPKSEIEQRVREAADMLGLTPYLDRKPKALSGGERQRVALGRALVRKPKVFLFDEPLSNLDARRRAQMRIEISRLHQRVGATMIYVTHDQTEAMALADRIAVIQGGVIQQLADPWQLYHRPANLFVGGFIGSPPMNFFYGTLERRNSRWAFVERDEATEGTQFVLRLPADCTTPLEDYTGHEIILGLRPEHISPVAIADPASFTSNNPVSAKIEAIEFTGAHALWCLQTRAHSFVAKASIDAKGRMGEKVALFFDLSKARFFDPITEQAIG